MLQTDIEERIFDIIAKITMRERSSLKKEMHLEADLGIDSISMASLVARLEPLILAHPRGEHLLQPLLTAATVEELIMLLEAH